MSKKGDGETSRVEVVVLLIFLGIGTVFLLKPATVTLGVYLDFLDGIPDPATLGPYGEVVAVAAMVCGGGLLRKRTGK